MENNADGEINIFGFIVVAVFLMIVVTIPLGIRFFFRRFDVRMKRRLASYELSETLDNSSL